MYRHLPAAALSLFLVLASINLISCSGKDEDAGSDSACDTTAISYAADIRPIITSTCAAGSSCHGSGSSNGNYNSFSELKNDADDGSVRQRVLISRNMPPGGMSNCNRLKIEAWLNAGAPNN